MASLTSFRVSMLARRPSCHRNKVGNGDSGIKLVAFSNPGKYFSSGRLQQGPMRFRVSCSAKPETVNKVCEVVKKQLALPDGTSVTGESTFSALGADSLDTVEIVMSLEEAFGISVEEDSAQSITTVQDAADLIEKLVEAKTS
ncbi:hypothetical protein HPP92_024982 [Vanilla planifolia]|uniref:Acyl carrier protein n=1 Tax=Vanilla planifolia TaxID=51239 RepID=A0A835PLT4_VANPL|nr:hypothetical protein HPP92_025277 [Vanilla planifolia]KAG0453678.1 hypothetical protein HPP92_024982 [Vanilla planifolia]